jgi:hypothetical protein
VNLPFWQPLAPVGHAPPTFTTGGGSLALVVAGVFELPPEWAFAFFEVDFLELGVVVAAVLAAPPEPVAFPGITTW